MTQHQRRPKPVAALQPTAAMVRAKRQLEKRSGADPVPWFKMKNEAGKAIVYVYDEIGYFGCSAQDFVSELNGLGRVSSVEVHLNSPGGDLFDGLAIFNALRRFPARVTSIVDGVAASAASVIAMAGDEVMVEKNAHLMIHEASGVCVGNGQDMQEMAALLDRTSGTLAQIYADACGGTAAHWRELMRAETWFDADEAVTAGLADEVLDGAEPRNSESFAGAAAWQRLTAGLRAGARPDLVAALLKNLNEK